MEWKENFYFDHNAYKNLCISSDDIPKIGEIFQRKLTEASEKDYDFNSHPKVKEFREKVWNIHHQGQPMPTAETQQGLEDEDIIMSQVRNSAICIHIPHTDGTGISSMMGLGAIKNPSCGEGMDIFWNCTF